MRRGTPELLVATLLLLVLGWYLWYRQRVIVDLRADARRSSAMWSRIYRALGAPTPGAESRALADLSNSIRTQGVPLILTDRNGVPAGHANLPFEDPAHPVGDDDPRVREYVA